MIGLPSGVRVWIAAGHTDMRRGMQRLPEDIDGRGMVDLH
jgi:transposase